MHPQRPPLLTLAATAALVALAAAPAAAQPGQPPAQAVQALLSLPHGLERLAPDDRARLDALVAAPGPAVQALEAAYQGQDLAALEGAAGLRAERAILLLGALGGPESRALLASWFAGLDEASDNDPALARTRRAHVRRGVVLEQLAVNPEPAVLQAVISGLDAAPLGRRAGDLWFLARAGRGDAAAITALEARIAKPNAPLASDPAARRALLVMRSGVPAATPPATPEAILDRLLELPLDAIAPLDSDQALIDGVRADPEAYAPRLSAQIAALDAAALAQEPGRTRFKSALWLLERLDERRAAPALTAAFLRADDALFGVADQAIDRRALLELRRGALAALRGRCPTEVGERVVERLSTGPPGWRPNAAAWLGRACAGDDVVRKRLTDLVRRRDPGASDPAVRAALRALERTP